MCRACAAELRPAPDLLPPPGVDRCIAVLSYDGPARDVVARIKYRNHRAVLDGLASAMASTLGAERARIDVVTWAPTTDARRRARGFDHAELLAVAVADRVGLDRRRLLRRRPGPPQTGRSLQARRRGPDLAPVTAVTGHVLVIDDVVTSGATAAAAARALRRAGAGRITVLAAARTPPGTRTQDRHSA